MEKDYTEKIIETEQRSKSNMKRLDEHDTRFKEVDSKLDDMHELTYAIKEIANVNGPVYVRLSRLATPVIYDENEKFEIGKGKQFGNGTDATVIATGVTVIEALKAKPLL